MNSPAAALRVMIIDHQPVAAAGTAAVLGSFGFDAWVVDADDAVRVHAEQRPDVVVIETSAAVRDPHAVVVALLARDPDARVMALSSQLTGAGVAAALDAGCLGVMPRSCTLEALAQAVSAVQRGEHHVHPAAVALLLTAKREREQTRPLTPLSGRELAVLALVADGLPNREIAATLGIGEQTVKTHVASVLRKLDVRDRAHAVSTALRRGLLR